MIKKIIGYLIMVIIFGGSAGALGWCFYDVGWEVSKMFIYWLVLGVALYGLLSYCLFKEV